ncbi:hypothetical protein HY837_04765 [archaeon]|nr:hypothetical protein [archaeon]
MRRYRGHDDSVKIIKDRQNIIDLLKNPSAVSREELMNAVMSCYSGNSYGDSNWPKVSGGWTTPEVPTIYGQFREQQEQLAQLSLDPGFITHLPEFIEFMEKFKPNTENFFEIREQFKQYLGYRTVWRGMILSEEEVNRMIHEGIDSNLLRDAKNMPASIEEFEANVLSVYFDALVEAHFHGENYHSPIISVSSHKDIAIAVGNHFGKKYESKDFYLFQIKIPELDSIFYTPHAVKTPQILQRLIDWGNKLHIKVNETECSYPWDKHTESYVLYKINSSEIVEVSKPEIISCSWGGGKQ